MRLVFLIIVIIGSLTITPALAGIDVDGGLYDPAQANGSPPGPFIPPPPPPPTQAPEPAILVMLATGGVATYLLWRRTRRGKSPESA